jgi:hypothetical protein
MTFLNFFGMYLFKNDAISVAHLCLSDFYNSRPVTTINFAYIDISKQESLRFNS